MRPATRPGPVGMGVLGALVAAVVLTAWVRWIPQPTPAYFPPGERHAYVSTFDPPTRPVEVVANSGDAQAFAALAMDPMLARPEVFYGGAPEAAYRAQRPLAGWLAWGLSLGDPDRVLDALAVLTVVGTGLFLGAVATLARDLGRRFRAVPALLVAPGVAADLRWLCPDVLGAGIAILGLVWWRRRPDRPWPAVALFTLGALTRETLVLVPLAALVHGVIVRRPHRALLPLAVAPVVLGIWVLVVRARIGAWPTEAGSAVRMSLPIVGLVRGLAGGSAITAVAALCTLACAAVALVRRPDPLLRVVLLAHLALASVMGEAVWHDWTGAGRPLLPLLGIAVVALLPAEVAGTQARGASAAASGGHGDGARMLDDAHAAVDVAHLA